VLILTSSPCRCGTPTTARCYIRQHRAWHSVCLYSLPCYVTRRYATTLSFTTSLHDSTTTINDPQQRPQQTDPRLSFTSIPRPRAAAIEARVTFIFFTHEGSGTHFCPFLVDLAPYPYRSGNKRKSSSNRHHAGADDERRDRLLSHATSFSIAWPFC
jgi:hypothetical protein